MKEPVIVTRYKTSDGEVFESRQEAIAYETKLSNKELANELLQAGKSIGFILRKLSCYVADDILDAVTKDSELCIKHWQCSGKPGYKVHKLAINMDVYVHGDVGSWSGAYGTWITLENLARYAKDKRSKL